MLELPNIFVGCKVLVRCGWSLLDVWGGVLMQVVAGNGVGNAIDIMQMLLMLRLPISFTSTPRQPPFCHFNESTMPPSENNIHKRCDDDNIFCFIFLQTTFSGLSFFFVAICVASPPGKWTRFNFKDRLHIITLSRWLKTFFLPFLISAAAAPRLDSVEDIYERTRRI